MTARLKPSALGPFVPGMNNRRPDFKLRPERGEDERRGDYLRSAVNADISTAGSVKRRQGYAQVLASSGCHSFWADGPDAFVVDGGNLSRVTGLPDDAVATPLRGGMSTRPVSYARAPDAVYFSDGLSIGRISGNTAATVNTPPLVIAPAATAGLGGALPAGRYGFCFTHRDASGRESGSTAPVFADVVVDGGAIIVSELPTAFPAGVVETVVYMTAVNDQTLMRALTLTTTPATVTFTVQPTLGGRCPTVLLRSMPAGSIVRYYRGRLLVASGPVLYYSEPYMHGLFNPTRGYMVFGADITVVEPTTGGLWVCADQTYWLGGGEIEAAVLDAVLPYGGVRGSSGPVPNSNDVFWFSPRGTVIATQSGQAKNQQEANVAVPASDFAAGLFRESAGHKQIVESTFSGGPNTMAAASYMDAEVIRKKVTL